MRLRFLILAAILSALAAAGAGGAAAPPTKQVGTLTVGLAMPSEGFQVGIVKGSEVVYAQGFEIDLARALTARLGLSKTVFLQNRFDRLYSAGPSRSTWRSARSRLPLRASARSTSRARTWQSTRACSPRRPFASCRRRSPA